MQNKHKKMQLVRWLSVFLLMMMLSAPLFLMNCNKNNKKTIEKKQIILISIDTLRGDHLSSYGYFRDTSPNLSKLIEDSVYYTNAYPNGCWTMPSHMSLLTGTLPSRHGISKDWESMQNRKYPKLNDSIKCISEILKPYHIKTLKFAKLPDELGFNRGFDKNYKLDPFANDKKFNKLLKDLESNQENDFFLFVHTWMVHAPYDKNCFLKEGRIDKKKRDYLNKFRRKVGRIPKNLSTAFRDFLNENHLFNVTDCVTLYDSGIHYVDQYIGKLINKSKKVGIYDNLMVIVISDHGEHFAEHYPDEFYDHHGKDYYEEFIKVPLIIKYPCKFRQKRIDQLVSLIDVLPTVLDFYEIEIPAFVQGDSLLKSHFKRNRKYLISEAVSIKNIERKMIRVGDLKYIITMQNPTEIERANWDSIIERRLFDLKADPLEKNNLYNDLKFRRLCIGFEKMLFRIIKRSAKTNRSVKETEIDEKTLEHLESLGYL